MEKTFDRDFVQTDHRSVWLDRRKWLPFENFLKEAKGKVDTVVIRAPEVLGDTYREFVMNLAALGDAGIKLEILPSETRGEMTAGVRLGQDGERELILERQVPPLLQNPKPPPKKPKSVISLLRDGRRPSVVIQTNGPDEIYCQADLLLKAEKEEFKPSSQGRSIVGFYFLTPGTLDEFLYAYQGKDLDLERLERHRLGILKNGWDSFVIQTEDGSAFIEEVHKEIEKEIEKEKV